MHVRTNCGTPGIPGIGGNYLIKLFATILTVSLSAATLGAMPVASAVCSVGNITCVTADATVTAICQTQCGFYYSASATHRATAAVEGTLTFSFSATDTCSGLLGSCNTFTDDDNVFTFRRCHEARATTTIEGVAGSISATDRVDC